MIRLQLPGMVANQPLAPRLAFCQPGPERLRPGGNRNPALAWHDVPPGTGSLVLLCIDRDAPPRSDHANHENRLLPASLPRVDFYHWVMIDIPPATNGIDEGTCSDGVVHGGKPDPAGPVGARQGLNDFTRWFAGHRHMQGQYHGYDGPCPPWNDTLVHRYQFRLYAIKVARLAVGDHFDGRQVEAAIRDQVIEQAVFEATYTLNRALSMAP